MYYELYVDVFFLMNFTMDTILLALLKKALACPVRYGRIIAGGVLGAVLTCVVVIWPCKTTWAKFIVFHGVINVLMLRTGLGLKWGRGIVQRMGNLYIESFLFRGSITVCGTVSAAGKCILCIGSHQLLCGVGNLEDHFIVFGERKSLL